MSSSVMARPSCMPKYVPQPGCVLYLEGQQDAKSAVIKDKSGSGNHGAITGAAWVRLPSGLWVLKFDGVDDWTTHSFPASLAGAVPFTVVMWVKIISISAVTHRAAFFGMGKAGSGKQFYLACYDTGGGHLYGAWYGDDRDSGLDMILGRWYHVGFVYTPAVLCQVYLNGALGFTYNTSVTVNLEAGALWLGRFSDALGETEAALTGVHSLAFPASKIAGIYQNERHLFRV